MNNVNPVCWFDIYVSDLERAKKFYEFVFDISLVDLPSEWGKQSAFPFEEKGRNATGALVERDDHTPSQQNTVVYFSCEDCIEEEGRAKSAGGKIVKTKTPIGEFGFVSILQDTEGNIIGLHSKK